jgi:hypothetical protein
MAEAAARPARTARNDTDHSDDGYDGYDPRHPMWADSFWDQYCRQPPAAAPAGPAARFAPSRLGRAQITTAAGAATH